MVAASPPPYRSILQVFSVPIAQEVAGTARLKFPGRKNH